MHKSALSVLDSVLLTGAAGQLAWVQWDGGSMLSGDVNGDGLADFSILLAGVATLSAADLIL